MIGRPHAERLEQELKAIRTELVEEVNRFGPDEFEWTPEPSMKSCRSLVVEIALMEQISVRFLRDGEELGWSELAAPLTGECHDAASSVAALDRIRAETLDYLRGCTEAHLETPMAVPEDWRPYFGEALEPEEIVRWVARHEYYHLGQLIIYRWMRGDNPYHRGTGG